MALYSEAALATVLVATALVQVPALAPGFFGWCAGLAAGSVLAVIRFDPEADRAAVAQRWISLVVGLWAVWGLYYGAMVLRRRRKARHA
jgi:hypothetical protein